MTGGLTPFVPVCAAAGSALPTRSSADAEALGPAPVHALSIGNLSGTFASARATQTG